MFSVADITRLARTVPLPEFTLMDLQPTREENAYEGGRRSSPHKGFEGAERLGAARLLTAALFLLAMAAVCVHQLTKESQYRRPATPDLWARGHSLSLILRAAIDRNGRSAFSFNGQNQAPTLHLFPGDQLKITYVNHLPTIANEPCAISPCMNMTNLHFHGLAVSPETPQDDVLTMVAHPGATLNYTVQIPPDHPPGLYWYHTHPHGESHRQALDGMSGVIVVEGMDRYVPEVRGLRERILMVRGREIVHDPNAAALRRQLEVSTENCGSESEPPEEVFTVNGLVRPKIEMSASERQFWRIANASADRYLDLELSGSTFEIVAMDGMPLAYHDQQRPRQFAKHVLLPPAGRLEAIVTGPPDGKPGFLRTRCVDTGPDGDPNPAMVLADITPGSTVRSEAPQGAVISSRAPEYKVVNLSREEQAPPSFIVTFTEDKNGFYINGQKFAADAAPMARVEVGSYQHWRIVNATGELHPMHIHQTHFLAFSQNGHDIADPVWLDTVNVPYGGFVDVIMDFTNPIIKGMSVFHCHLLNHEDKGMMAKVLFE